MVVKYKIKYQDIKLTESNVETDVNSMKEKNLTVRNPLLLAISDKEYKKANDILEELKKDTEAFLRVVNKQYDEYKGATALIFAARQVEPDSNTEYFKMCENLIASINIAYVDNETALMTAVRSQNSYLVKLLLQNGADVNIQTNKYRMTPLMLAVINNDINIVAKLLLVENLNINAKNKDGHTALFAAIISEYDNMVRLLLEKNPDLNIQDINGNTVLITAVLHKSISVIELLLRENLDPNIRKPDLNIRNNDGNTALITAVLLNDIPVIKLLLKEKPNLDIQNNDGNTALITAVLHNNIPVIELLLRENLDPNIRKPDLNIQNNDGNTALITAVLHNNIPVLELLLKEKPNLNIQNNAGNTALLNSVMYDSINPQVVKLLLKENPTLTIKNKENLDLYSYL